jgi:hypothetical protein
MTIDLEKLEAIARAAQERSPGPWRRWRHGEGEIVDGEIDCVYDSKPAPPDYATYADASEWHGNAVLETDGGYYEPKGATAVHIAAFSPDVVLKLIERLRIAELSRDEALRECIRLYERLECR